MIDFELTDEQREMRDMARRFAEKEIRPVAAEYDEREEAPWEVIEKAAATTPRDKSQGYRTASAQAGFETGQGSARLNGPRLVDGRFIACQRRN